MIIWKKKKKKERNKNENSTVYSSINMRCMQRLFSMLNYQEPFNRHNFCSHFCLFFVSLFICCFSFCPHLFLARSLSLSAFISVSISFRNFISYFLFDLEARAKLKEIGECHTVTRVTYDYMNNAKADALTEWKWNKWKVQTCTPQTRLHDGMAHQNVW